MPSGRFESDNFYAELEQLYREGTSQQVLQYLEGRLACAREAEDSYAVVTIANELGGAYRIRGQVDKALVLYEEVLRHLRAQSKAKTPSYATALTNLGSVYMVAKRYDEALEAYNRSAHLLIAARLESSALRAEHRDIPADYQESRIAYALATLYNNRSATFGALGRIEDGICDLRMALHLLDDSKEQSSQWAVSSVNLAELYIKQGKFDEALDCLGKALALFTAQYPHDIHFPNALATLGELKYLQGDYQSSEQAYGQAVALLEAKFGSTPLSNLLRENQQRARRLSQG